MVLNVFTIRDAKSEAYNAPFFKLTEAEAIRDFTRLAKDSKTMVAEFPSDFDLYSIGVFDDQTGKINAHDTPRHIVKAINLLSAEA